MKILNKDKNYFKIQVTSDEDFWYLSQIISEEDYIMASTYRKINLSNDSNGDAKSKIVKKKYHIKIKVKNINIEKNTHFLKINGIICESKYNEIPNGTYQSINLEINDIFELLKLKIWDYQKEKIHEATKPDTDNILICLLDRETAKLCIIGKNNIENITNLTGEVAKKDKRLINIKSTFYEDINKSLEDIKKNRKITHIIIGCSKIFANEIKKQLGESINKITTFTTTNSITQNGVYEILKNPELKGILKNKNIAENVKLIEEFLLRLSKENKVCYGYKDVKLAAESGAIETLIISDNLIFKYQEKEKYNLINDILKKVSNTKGNIKIINSK
ncbi:pelota family protein, partial [Candidatus Woesearchaeota archaeon]|nr:pelota family protein [Candidatus Woesearchaeota archaeon]